MQRFNFPTTIYYGEGSLAALVQALKERRHRKILVVTDKTLLKLDPIARLGGELERAGISFVLFGETHPNPIEEDVEKGVKAYNLHGCDSLLGLGGGSPMDVAKVIRLMVCHDGPLERFDDARGGADLIVNSMPSLYAVPTTAGTGSEVGRSGVIILRSTGKKTIFFHPRLIPDIAALEPALTTGLPPAITAATGIDAFTHCLEAFLATGFHPFADGIALEGLRLILASLPTAVKRGGDLEARGKMQIAASMGATAFQKGLGMIHSLAHPLSARYNIHHGLANALLLPSAVAFMEKADLGPEQRARLSRIMDIFREAELAKDSLAESCRAFFLSLDMEFGLSRHSVPEADLEVLSEEAFQDSCHATNLIPVQRKDLFQVYAAAL